VSDYLDHPDREPLSAKAYWAAGFMGVHDGNLAAVNQQIIALKNAGVDVLTMPQWVSESANHAIARIEGQGGFDGYMPTVEDYRLAGIQGVTIENLESTNALMAKAAGALPLDVRVIQSFIDSPMPDGLEASAESVAFQSTPTQGSLNTILTDALGFGESYDLMTAISKASQAQQKTANALATPVEPVGTFEESLPSEDVSAWIGGQKLYESKSVEGIQGVPLGLGTDMPSAEKSADSAEVPTIKPYLPEDWIQQHG
jgi:hypothetical protein